MKSYRVTVNGVVEITGDYPSPTHALADAIENFLPKEERLSIRVFIIEGRAEARTRNYRIVAHKMKVEVS